MDLAQLSIKRPVFITCIVTLILLIGFLCLRRLPVDLFPNVTFPTVVVTVPYPGAGPSEVETLIAKVLEEELSGIAGIEKLRSTSKEGIAQVIAEFSLKTDIKYAEQQMRDRVSAARRKLPDDIKEPTIKTVDPSDQPIAIISLVAPGLKPGDLYDVADQVVKPKIEQVNQVGLVEILGGRKREIQIQLDMNKLRAYKITTSQVSKGLESSGENVPAGKTNNAESEVSYRTIGEFRDLSIIPQSLVRFVGDEHPLAISQVGKVVDTLQDEVSKTFVNGNQALLLYVFRQSGANTIDVVDRVNKTLVTLNENLKNKGIQAQVELVRDGAKRIRDNVDDVYESIFIGVILTILVVYLFLGSFRSTIITGLALPNSLLGAFILMAIAGFTINIMSLLALSLAVGLLIDDAIVVRENIFRHMEMGKDPEQAALDGTKEVRLAVIATTLAILAVFGPIGMLQGVTGQFFKEFGLTICFAMLISLFDALTIAPMLSAYFAGNLHKVAPKTKIGQWNESILKSFDRFQTNLENAYEKVLHYTLKAPLIVIAINIGLFVGSLYATKWIPKTFIPAQDNGEFLVGLDLPPGTSLDKMSVLANEIDQKVRSVKEVKRTVLTVGNRDGQPNYAEISVELVKKGQGRTQNTTDMKNTIREMLKPYAYAHPAVKDGDATGGGQRQFNMNLLGDDLKQLEQVSQQVWDRLKQHAAFTDVDSSFRPGKPEYQFVIPPGIAQEAGLNTKTVGNELRSMVEGTTPALYRAGDREYEVRVRLQDDQRNLKETWKNALVPNINQSLVPLGLVAQISENNSPSNIRREDRARSIQISADVNPKGPGLGFALQDVTRILKEEIKLPPGVSFGFYGQAERFKELIGNMIAASGLGILFIYFVLSSLYESFVTPFAIMLVLPLAAIGAFFGLLISQTTLDLYSMIGCVMLLGLATKNSILLVDYINHLMKDGVERSEAIVRACRTRLRPILMTSLALIAGMVPVAIGLNEASKQRTSLGVAVIGGTISSTILTLVLIPATFIYFDRLKNWLDLMFNRHVRGQKAMVSATAGHLNSAIEIIESENQSSSKVNSANKKMESQSAKNQDLEV